MKQTHKLLFLFIVTLLLSSMLLGCAAIPEEYTKGVKLDKNYPDDDMPIMDDAIVYFSDGDDEEITIKYGVSDDLDDVVDFYKDFFDDNDISLSDETDKDTKYTAQGYFQDFIFEIRVTQPSGEYEEKQFVTTVKVQIEFADEPLVPAGLGQGSLESELIGFWRQESSDNEAGSTQDYDLGLACEFTASDELLFYGDFEYLITLKWSVIDETTILIVTPEGQEGQVTITLEQRSGIDYLIWEEPTGVYVYFRDTSEEFSMGDSAGSAPGTADEQLTSTIEDVNWYFVYFSDSDGVVTDFNTAIYLYKSDGTFKEIFEGDSYYGTWYLEDAKVWLDYDDGTRFVWAVEFKTEGGTTFMYVYNPDNPEFWVFSEDPSDQVSAVPTSSTTFTSDSDMTSNIVNGTWYDLHYKYPDGSTGSMNEIVLSFSTDGAFSESINGEEGIGTWYIDGGNLYLTYTNTDEKYYYPIRIEYVADSDSYLLYYDDLEEGYEGGYWVFTTYEP